MYLLSNIGTIRVIKMRFIKSKIKDDKITLLTYTTGLGREITFPDFMLDKSPKDQKDQVHQYYYGILDVTEALKLKAEEINNKINDLELKIESNEYNA
jgi:hypothetical protein